MARIHYVCLFRGHDEYVVFHPSVEAEAHQYAATLPVHAVGRIRSGNTFGYLVDNTPLLWKLMRRAGNTVCAACTKASCDTEGYSADKKPVGVAGAKVVPCPDVVWDEKWIRGTGMSRFETVTQFEEFWNRVADALTPEPGVPVVPMAVHEGVLGIVPPYDRDGVLRAFKTAALRTHPDRPGGSAEAFQRVVIARDALLPSLGG